MEQFASPGIVRAGTFQLSQRLDNTSAIVPNTFTKDNLDRHTSKEKKLFGGKNNKKGLQSPVKQPKDIRPRLNS